MASYNIRFGITDAPSGRFLSVSAGGSHSCALRQSGQVKCWGYNSFGQADDPSGRYRDVSAAGEHSCAVRETGELDCLGVRFQRHDRCTPGAVPLSQRRQSTQLRHT